MTGHFADRTEDLARKSLIGQRIMFIRQENSLITQRYPFIWCFRFQFWQPPRFMFWSCTKCVQEFLEIVVPVIEVHTYFWGLDSTPSQMSTPTADFVDITFEARTNGFQTL